jgi:hypothetical protein
MFVQEIRKPELSCYAVPTSICKLDHDWLQIDMRDFNSQWRMATQKFSRVFFDLIFILLEA